MKIKKSWYYIVMYLPLLVTVIALFFLPDQVPMHYGANNEVNRWGSKYEELIIPVLIIGFGYFMLLMAKTASNSEQEGNTNNEKITMLTGFLSLILFNAMNIYFLYAAFQQVTNLGDVDLDIYSMMFAITGIIFIIIGNQMPKAKMNAVMGLRTTWSMKNEEAWKKSQKFGGTAFMIGGIAMSIGSLFFFKGFMVMLWSIGLLLAVVVVSVVYSYRVSKIV